ncbi:MAG TPA: multiheme c-type cytochrome, partial [Dissulfurispiraceae bacterium]|nr:multiheme c-type cytochrome [Dissulfurispiraceae bacterium]
MKKTVLILCMMLGALLVVSGSFVIAADMSAPSSSGPEYVGSAKCKMCHKVEHDSWNLTYHSKLIGEKDERMLKEVVEKWETDGVNPGPTKGNGTGQKFTRADVQYTIGSKWKQRYLVKNEDTGGYQFLDKQFNRMSGKWENYGQKHDWNTTCGTCHTTGYRLVEYDEKNPKAQKTAWVETSIGCEACHGPGGDHVKGTKKGTIFTFAGKTPQEQSRVCGYCHIRLENEQFKTAQGGAREDFPAPKVGDSFKPSDDWTKWYPEHVIIPGVQANNPFDKAYVGDLKGLFIVDDISKKNGVYEEAKHHQEYQGFIQSKHYNSAGMSCLSCHTLHATKKQ